MPTAELPPDDTGGDKPELGFGFFLALKNVVQVPGGRAYTFDTYDNVRRQERDAADRWDWESPRALDPAEPTG